MYLTPKLFSGIWFSSGTIITVLIVLITKNNGDYYDGYNLILMTFFGGTYSFLLGSFYNDVIITQENFSIKKLIRLLLYGCNIVLGTLYGLLFSMISLDYFGNYFLHHIHEKPFTSIIYEILQLPLLASFATIMACIFEPFVLMTGCLGTLFLFLFRKRALSLCGNEKPS